MVEETAAMVADSGRVALRAGTAVDNPPCSEAMRYDALSPMFCPLYRKWRVDAVSARCDPRVTVPCYSKKHIESFGIAACVLRVKELQSGSQRPYLLSEPAVI